MKIPFSIEAEKAILGAILNRPECINEINSNTQLQPEYFFHNIHRAIYEAIQSLEAENVSADVITVAHKFQNMAEKENQVVSLEYLVELTQSCPLTHNLNYYAKMIKDKFLLRKMIETCQSIIIDASQNTEELGSLIEKVEKSILDMTNLQDQQGGLMKSKGIVVATIEEIEKRLASNSTVTGVPSGFHVVDEVTGGWQNSDLIILAARPGMGKTALALNLALNAVKGGKTVAVFSLEMSKTQLMERLFSSEGHVDSSKLRKGDLSEDEQNRLLYAAKSISVYDEKLAIDETPSITLSDLRSRCRRYKKEFGLDMIIIDYLQLMGSTAKNINREQEVAIISKGLKGLAKELNVPIITLSQLNRGPDNRPTDKRPKTSDLRESGSLEQDADIIVFVYRDEYYNKDSEESGVSEIIFAKNRHGEQGTVNLAFLPNFVSFYNLEK